MSGIRYPAVIAAAAAGFVVGGLWYSPLLFGDAWSALRGTTLAATAAATPPPGELVLEFVRCLVVAWTFAYFILRLRIITLGAALQLALVVWIGFQGFVLSGSVLHEGYPVKLFLIHAGDALAKAMIYCVILALWHKRAAIEATTAA